MRQAEIGYFLIPSFTADDARSVEQSLSPIITALRAFGVTAALATVVGVLVLVLRHLRRREREVAVWRSLGLGAAGRSAGIGIGPVAAAALGALGGAVAALAASPVGPVASARTIVPRPGHSLTAVTLGAGVAALFLLVVPTAVLAWRTAVRAHAGVRARRRPSWEASLPGSPMAALGLRVAFRGRDAMPAILGAASAVTVVTATLVFATGLDQLVDTPTRFGWPFDLAVLGNAGYGPVDREAIAADLDRPGVDGWGLATLTGNLTIDGETVPILAGREGFDALVAGTSVVDGHVPTGADEIGIGARTADDLGVGVGDEVTIGSPYGEHDVQVSGIVVLPTVGPLESDSTSVGTGALLPAPLLEATYDGAEEATGMTAVELADVSAALVVVDLAPGVDPQAFVEDLGEGILRWDGSGAFLRVYAEPLRPAAIIDVAAMRGVPALLAGVFGLAMIGTVVAGLISGTRARRHEIAVLRALGATPRQRRSLDPGPRRDHDGRRPGRGPAARRPARAPGVPVLRRPPRGGAGSPRRRPGARRRGRWRRAGRLRHRRGAEPGADDPPTPSHGRGRDDRLSLTSRVSRCGRSRSRGGCRGRSPPCGRTRAAPQSRGVAGQVVGPVGREQDHDGVGGGGHDLAGGLDAVDAGQVDVHQDQRRVQRSAAISTASSPEAASPTTSKPAASGSPFGRRRGTAPGRRR